MPLSHLKANPMHNGRRFKTIALQFSLSPHILSERQNDKQAEQHNNEVRQWSTIYFFASTDNLHQEKHS